MNSMKILIPSLILFFLFLSCNTTSKNKETSIEVIDTTHTNDADDWGDWDNVQVFMDSMGTIEEKDLQWNSDSFNLSLDSTLVSYWTFSQLYQIVLSEFPEAYDNFVDITFSGGPTVTPETISFLIPTVKLSEIDSVELQYRFDRVSLKMSGFKGGCAYYEIGESKTYDWDEWEDKTVTKIYYHFMFAC